MEIKKNHNYYIIEDNGNSIILKNPVYSSGCCEATWGGYVNTYLFQFEDLYVEICEYSKEYEEGIDGIYCQFLLDPPDYILK